MHERMLLLITVVTCISLFPRTSSAQCSATVQQGSRGECVKVVQRAVGTTADGIFGKNTKAAVIAYQKRHGLVADGIVGAKTWGKINGGGSPSGSSSGCGCRYDYASGCSGGPSPGGRKLAAYLKRKFGSRQEIYECRKVVGGGHWSLHAEGRAIDHFTSGKAGQATADHLVSIACKNGIQEVIFNRKIWVADKGWQPYNGQNPHIDHVHVGLNKCGAAKFSL